MQIEVKNHIINYSFINEHLFESEKPLIVFLHDGLGSIAQMKDYPNRICDTTNLAGIVYDRIGYGLSSKRKRKINSSYLHDEAMIYLPELIHNLGIDNKLILVGHSDGATIALLFASFFPEKVIAVVSEAAHVIVEDITVEGIRNVKESYHSNPALLKSLQKYHGEKTSNLFKNWIELWLTDDIKEWNIIKNLKNINIPVLAIQGEKDEFGSFKQLETINDNVNADVDIFYISDCGHFPHFEKEIDVNKKVTEFIKNNYNKSI
jgi:pimeloyl-ACP methyl ester carboxylesterase